MMKRPQWRHAANLMIPLCLGFGLALTSHGNAAEDPGKFPSKPITLIINFAPGSVTDLTGRKLADLAGKVLGQPIVAENKLGGAGVMGLASVAKAAPDGYTLGTVTYSQTVIVPHLRSVPYDVKKDFSWIMDYVEMGQTFCVLGDARWKTFKEFIEEARRKPGALTYATNGPRSGQHIVMEQIALAENVKLSHVPTAGGTEVVTQLLGGHVDAALAGAVGVHIRSGKVRPLAVAGQKRLEMIPNVPTFRELGYQIECPLWMGLLGPSGLDPLILRKIHDAFKKAYEDPSFKELLTSLVMTPDYHDPESFRNLVMTDFAAQKRILDRLGFTKTQ
jgi:tripartite-type tricarboxylate transporter receptor subunit TctC